MDSLLPYPETKVLKRKGSEKTVLFENSVQNLSPKKQLRLLNSLSQLENDLKISSSEHSNSNTNTNNEDNNSEEIKYKQKNYGNFNENFIDSLTSKPKSLTPLQHQNDGLNQIRSSRNITDILITVGKALNSTEKEIDLSGVRNM